MKSISTPRLILILGAMAAIGPMSIDMYLPSLPALQTYFAVEESIVQLTLVAFFIGLAGGQLIYGPLSDRFGRKKPLLIGLIIYTLASYGCSVSNSIYMLIGFRFLQAFGGCAGMVISRAIVRDLFEPQEMARVMSLLLLVMGICPILAPLAGTYLFQHFGWNAIFTVVTVFGVSLFVLVAHTIPETLQHPAQAMTPRSVIVNYGTILSQKIFMSFALCGGFSFAGLFSYIAASSFVLINTFGLSVNAYGWIFGLNAGGLILGSQLNRFLLSRHTSHYIIKRSVAVYAISGLFLLLFSITGWGGVVGILAPLFVCVSSLGFIFPNSTAIAMSPFSQHAGSASALVGTLQFSCAAVAGAVVGRLPLSGAVAMASVIAVCGFISVSLLYLGQQSSRQSNLVEG